MIGNAIGTILPDFASGSVLKKSLPNTISIPIIKITTDPAKAKEAAAPYKAKIAIYPHVGNYCETSEHSVRLAKMVNRPNVGAIFNTCHLLKKEGEEEWEPVHPLFATAGVAPGTQQHTNIATNNSASRNKSEQIISQLRELFQAKCGVSIAVEV